MITQEEVNRIWMMRIQTWLRMGEDSGFRKDAQAYYAKNPIDWICRFVDTHDPRRDGKKEPRIYPLLLFDRQKDLVRFILACMEGKASGLIEKSRDVGATWTCCALSVWLWLYWEHVAIGWGSRKEALVDRLSDPSSIFEKIRRIIERIHPAMLPHKFKRLDHLLYMRVINPATGSSIIGEAGDNIGRGGRTTVYFKDESAYYQHAEAIDSALLSNTNTQIDISSVSGLGTPFARKREGGKDWKRKGKVDPARTNVFILDWRHHPEKTEAWYRIAKAKSAADGQAHIFAQEVDRDYSAALSDTLIKREWIQAAIDLHLRMPGLTEGAHMAGLDVADEGRDANALAIRKGRTLVGLDTWTEGDTGETARRALQICQQHVPIVVQYDSAGVGAGVKAEFNRTLGRSQAGSIQFTGWNSGSSPVEPDSYVVPDDPQSGRTGDFYDNLGTQAWWNVRNALERTWRAVHQGAAYPADELISIDGNALGDLLLPLEKELCQIRTRATPRLKQGVVKSPLGTRSPNLADAFVMAFFAIEADSSYVSHFFSMMGVENANQE